MNWHIIALEETDSTNAEALRRLPDLPSGTLITARIQTAGRGRAGRRWVSPPGRNVCASLILKPQDGGGALEASSITQAAGLALQQTLHALGLRQLLIKWPNDLLCAGRKICGMLCEAPILPDGRRALILGIGVNILADESDFAGLDQPATSLLLALRPATCPQPDEILHAWLDKFRPLLDLARDQPQHLRDLWIRHSGMLGREVDISGAGPVFSGTVSGLAPDGALILLTARGPRHVHSGDVSLRLRPEK